MKQIVWTVIVMATIACASHTSPTPVPDSGAFRVQTGVETTLVRMIPVGTINPRSGAEALAQWKADVPAVDSGGECELSRSSGSGATFVRAMFPSARESRTTIALSFDSAGRLIRFSESRGMNVIKMPPGTTTARARDSVLAATVAANRSTTITLDLALDHGMAMNRGGNAPVTAVRGNVREMESLEQFGPPKARIARARKLCGV
jgi:hypothetical protein